MHIQAILLAILVNFIWGSNFVITKIGVTEIPPMVLLTLRFSLTGLLFLPFMQWPGWRQASLIACVGLFMGLLHQGTLYMALEIMPAGLTSLLLQSSVIFVTLLGWLMFKETIGWRTWLGIALGILGVAILMGGPNISAPAFGYILCIVSAIFIALTYAFMKHVGNVNPYTYLTLISLPIAPFIGLSAIGIHGTEWMKNIQTLNWPVILSVLSYHVIIVSFSHVIWQRLINKYPMSEVVPWTMTIPVFGILLAIPVFGESLTWSILIGGVLTIAGIGIITFRKIKKEKDATDIAPHNS